jgi:16S rRNA (guanine527-N7)-methyltransferase
MAAHARGGAAGTNMSRQRSEADRLVAGAARLGVSLSAEAAVQLCRLLDELERWNRAYNLTAVRDRAAMLPLHLLDSLSVLPALRGRRIIDVGTGPGFPGLPLAIADPGRHYTLLDSHGKKVRFVEHVLRVLAIANAGAVHSRVEDYRPAQGFDTVVARAFAPAARFAAGCRHLLAPGGQILMLKGRNPEAELAELGGDWQVDVLPLEVPGLEQARHLVRLTRAPSASPGVDR